MENEILPKNKRDLIYFLVLLSKWKKYIVITVLGITTLAIIISLLLPKWYQSSGTLLPPKNPNPFSALGLSPSNISKQLNPLRSLGTMLPNQDLYNYIAILKSRNLMERVIYKFDLINVYGIKNNSMSDAIEELKENVEFKVTEEGTLQINVIDKRPLRAAEMVDYYFSTLDELNRNLSALEARSNREFIEQRTNQNIENLNKAEEEIKIFQEKYSFIAIPEQTSSSMSGIAELFTLKTIKELELQILKKTVSGDNPRYKATALEIFELDKKLKNIPELGNQYLKLYREYIIQKKLHETLVPILEQAKIEENRDTPTLLILDKPVPAEKAKLPRKKIIVIIFFFISLISSITFIIIVDHIEKIRSEQPGYFQQLAKYWSLFKK